MKPVILITPKFAEEPTGFGVGGVYRVLSNYCRAVVKAGGTPVVCALGEADAYADLADGVIFTGSNCDIQPGLYGQENRKAAFCDPCLDQMELELFDAFVKRGKPVLGICRGVQLLNVALGGTLMQDIEEEVPALTVHAQVYSKATEQHAVTAAPGSLFARLFGEEFTVNSYHHQAAKDCGKGLLPTVVTEEGVIEAVEHESLPIFGTQWHPERMIGEEQTALTDMLPLFTHFIACCNHK